MSISTTIDNSCPRCKHNKPIHVQVGEKHWIKCANCSWAFELLGTDESSKETLEFMEKLREEIFGKKSNKSG